MNYNEEFIKRLRSNVDKVLKEIDSEHLKLKISNWANQFGYSFDEIKNKVINDKIFRCVFAKNPSTQNLYQNLAAEYISSLEIVKNFKVLPAGGKNAIYLINGKVLKGDLLKNQSKDIKSVDFMWNCKNLTFYVSHKYTKMAGGSQDNQYKDIQNFLNHTRDCNEKNVIFLAICDGDFYLQKDSKTGDETKIERLQRLTDGKTSFVLTINELNKFLVSLFNDKIVI